MVKNNIMYLCVSLPLPADVWVPYPLLKKSLICLTNSQCIPIVVMRNENVLYYMFVSYWKTDRASWSVMQKTTYKIEKLGIQCEAPHNSMHFVCIWKFQMKSWEGIVVGIQYCGTVCNFTSKSTVPCDCLLVDNSRMCKSVSGLPRCIWRTRAAFSKEKLQSKKMKKSCHDSRLLKTVISLFTSADALC